MSARRKVRLGADIGGTFTDIAMEVGSEVYTTKILTTPDKPEEAVVDGLQWTVRNAGISAGGIDIVIHGTTLAANSLIERRGAKTAFLTTAGFRDVVEMRKENRFEQYDLNIVLPPPLIERDSRFVAGGRIGASGRELQPLDESAVAAFAEEADESGYESIAVGFLHSYANPTHERRARDIIERISPRLNVSISSEVSPQMREFERFSTVCANAFVRPLMESYLRRLAKQLEEIGATCPVFVMHSGGGLVPAETAMRFPVRLLESGPAGGAIYAADIAQQHGLGRAISYDMGGTTAKICLIEKSPPRTGRVFEVARTYRFKKGSGMPVSVPAIEMVEIGAGGGSCARVDGMRQIRVGPESAGSAPGPACYQLGGVEATVTDADLLLGKIDPRNFAGGAISLSPDSAADALLESVGRSLGMDAGKAAAAVSEVVDESMAAAARVHAVETGRDLGEFTMVAFGGAAPLHAARLCEKLGIDRLLVPPGAGVGSAIGFLRAPFGYEAVRSSFMRLSDFNPGKALDVLGEIAAETAEVAQAGDPEANPVFERRAHMRYAGQGWEIPVELPRRLLENLSPAALRLEFEKEYRRLYGRALPELDIEILSWTVTARIPAAARAQALPIDGVRSLKAASSRRAFDARLASYLDASVVERSCMRPGDEIAGPAAIVEAETTTVVTSAFLAAMQADGSLLLSRRRDDL